MSDKWGASAPQKGMNTMTTFEFFKAEYDKVRDYGIKCINPEVQVDSFQFVQIAWRNFFGSTAQVDAWYNIRTVDDTKEMFDLGYLKKWDDTSWAARQRGTSRHVALTAKGLRVFYKEMF
jgi:hypothetical protein